MVPAAARLGRPAAAAALLAWTGPSLSRPPAKACDWQAPHRRARRPAPAPVAASAHPALAANLRQQQQQTPDFRQLTPQAQLQPPQQQAPAMPFLVKNGERQPCELASGPWLEQAPRGSFTTARTVGGSSVLELTLHLQRLANTAGLMMEEAAAAEPPPALPPAAAAAADPEQLRPAVLGAMRAAVAGYRAASGDSDGELRLTVLVTWQAGSPAAPGTQPAAPGEPAAQAGQQAATGDRAGFDVWVHAAPLPPRPAPPVTVVMRGSPRHNAEAKDSEWVRQRKALQRGLPPGVEEVVLVGEGGELFEGLSSNFFAVVGGAVRTAGQGVLAGTVREVALAVARREGIPVVLRPPTLAELEAWEGCFITSTSRLLLPVDEAGVFPKAGSPPSCGSSSSSSGGGGGGGGEASWHVQLQRVRRFERGGLVQRLERLVLAELAACSEPLF